VPYDDTTAAGSNAGSAYVFTRSGGTWSQQDHLFADDAAAGDAFGDSVAIDGNAIVVGATYDDTAAGLYAGSAYVFTRFDPFGTWPQVAHLFADDAYLDDLFGDSVAISGNTIVVGADNDDTAAGSNAGSAYVFTRSGGTWSQQDHLFADDAAAGDGFGGSVAISGDTIVVGEEYDDTAAGNDAGSAYVFGPPFRIFIAEPEFLSGH
jgi:glutamate synthase domain-containing protein 3